jgi:hypothetical protein
MASKENFSARDWEFLTHFPARVGLWMAHQDEGGGESALRHEMEALHGVISRVQAKYRNFPLLRELAEALEQTPFEKDESWVSTLDDIPHALGLIHPFCDVTEVNCFKLMLLDIAEAVARAAPDGELEVRNLYGGPENGWFGLYPLLAKIVRLGRGPKVSRAEKIAINRLIGGLGAEGIAQRWALDPFQRSSQA